MKVLLVSAIAALSSIAAATQFLHMGRLIPPVDEADEFPSSTAVALNSTVSTTGNAFFTQLLDHDNPGKGFFLQKFWWNSEYWAGPGSPVIYCVAFPSILANNIQVVLFTPGEISAANYGAYLTNATITGLYAQEIKGAVVMVERGLSRRKFQTRD